MIRVDGQYIFRFSIGTIEDFISQEDLVEYGDSEEAGNTLPKFDFTFKVSDERILRELNEGNSLKVSYGVELNDLKDVEFIIQRQGQVGEEGEGSRIIKITGLLNKFEYINNPALSISSDKSGIALIQEVAAKHFPIIDSNIATSNDSQKWIQNNISDKFFIKELWMHSYLSDSFVAIGISADKFILRDVKKLLATKPVWRFIQNGDKSNDISYDQDFIPVSDSGFINAWLGYGKNKLVHSIEDNVSEEITEDFKPLLSMASKLSRKATIEARYADVGILNDNVHDNYHRAALKNLSNLAIFSSSRITLSFQNLFRPLQLLDLVMFKTGEIGSATQHSSGIYTGLYLISKITRNLTQHSLSTTIELTRESFNETRGNFR